MNPTWTELLTENKTAAQALIDLCQSCKELPNPKPVFINPV